MLIAAAFQCIFVFLAGLQSFARLVGDLSYLTYGEATPSTSTPASSSSSAISPPTTDSYLLRQLYELNINAEQEHKVSIFDILPIVKEATYELREACVTAIAAAKSTIDFVNHRRWKRPSSLDEENSQALALAMTQLREALVAFKDTHRKRIVEPYLPLIQGAKTKREKEALPLKALYVSLVFAANLISASECVVLFLETVQGKVEKRTKNRLWAPKGLRALWKLFTARGDAANAAFGEDITQGASGEDDDVDDQDGKWGGSFPSFSMFKRLPVFGTRARS
jgi:hypothetical protein